MAKQKSVRAEINALELGEFADYPLDRYNYIVNCRSRLQIVSNKRFTSEIKRDLNIVRITRVADFV